MFSINTKVIKAEKLKISSKLIKLGKVVDTEPEKVEKPK
jgi:hypothetical protein